MPAAWSFALARLLAGVAVAVGLGLVFGGIEWWLAGVLGGLLAWQLANLFLLQRWLRHRSEESPPDLAGVWGDVVGLVGGIYRSKQYHKRRVLVLLREFRRLSAALPDGVVLLSGDNEIVWFNRMAAQLLGFRRKVDFGAPIENLIRMPAFVRYLRSSQTGSAIVLPLQGAERQLALRILPAGGQKLMLVRDVTREARLELMRSDFVANASHELRSPLTVVLGYLEQLSGDPKAGPEWQGPVDEMRRQAERMQDIIEDLLELSQLESAGDEAPLEPVDMPRLLRDLAAEPAWNVPAGPRLELQLDSGDGLLGDARELRSIATNLLSNAMKYTPAGGRVMLRWWTDAAGGHLAVSDTGAGIAAEHLPRLTERFYRVDRARARSTGGSGLGLSIVKHGLQRHRGRLEIASVEGRGSTFTAHFPARRILPIRQAAAIL